MAHESQYWQQRWQDGQTGWDIGKPHRLTPKLWQLAQASLDKPQGKLAVYVPGCGQAHDAAFFAKLGHDVVAADFAPGAIAAAKKTYGTLPNMTCVVADAAQCPPEEIDQYDVIFDRAMLCALRPELRDAFLRACLLRLRSGGLFISLPFTKTAGEPGSGPPFEISTVQLRKYFTKSWELVRLEPDTTGHITEKILEEALLVARCIKAT